MKKKIANWRRKDFFWLTLSTSHNASLREAKASNQGGNCISHSMGFPPEARQLSSSSRNTGIALETQMRKLAFGGRRKSTATDTEVAVSRGPPPPEDRTVKNSFAGTGDRHQAQHMTSCKTLSFQSYCIHMGSQTWSKS